MGTVPSASSGIIVILIFHFFFFFFTSLTRSKYLSIFAFSSIFIRSSAGTAKSTKRQIIFFLSISTRSFDWHWMIYMNLKITETCMRLIFKDEFWFVHIPLGSRVKIQSFAQFLVDYLSYSGVPSLVLLLCKFATFAYCAIYYPYFLLWEFFTLTLADDFPLEFEWQQVSSSLQDSSYYSGRALKCSCLDGLYLSFYFQVFQSLY